jgi:hypothetical protein
MPKLPNPPLDFRETGRHLLTTHKLEKDFYALVVSRMEKQSLDLLFLGLFAAKIDLDAFSRLEEDFVRIKMNTLMSHISNKLRREALTSHVLFYKFTSNYPHLDKVKQNNLYEEVIKDTGEIYKLLVSYGEPAPATILATIENVSVRTIQSRLRLAREKGFLEQPGSGKRFS